MLELSSDVALVTGARKRSVRHIRLQLRSNPYSLLRITIVSLRLKMCEYVNIVRIASYELQTKTQIE